MAFWTISPASELESALQSLEAKDVITVDGQQVTKESSTL
jgi:HAMP domain-containing protein